MWWRGLCVALWRMVVLGVGLDPWFNIEGGVMVVKEAYLARYG